MPDIRLQDYTAKIKDMIRNVRLDEAIAHGQQILREYPKHIEAYCLLGEACLEKELYREAIEFFQRALSADPENLIARVGLGVIYDEQGALPEAIWQLERAFELAPGNTEVRRELQRLYARQDGVERARLRLTRGALGRLYSRNGLYARAIGEFLAVLRQDPDLPDVRVALAEALWHEGRKLEAVDVCQELVESLPNCLKANLILGEVWTRGENEEEGQEKLKLAQELDPENRIAQEMMGRSSPLPPEEIFISELEAVPEGLDLAATEWGFVEAGARAVVEEGLLPGAAEPGEGEEELPDWLRDMGMLAGEELATELETEEAALTEAHPEEAISAEEMPEWLQEVFEESEGEEAVPLAAEDARPEGVPDEGMDTVVTEAPAPELEDQQVEAIPEWLQELVAEEAPSELAEEAVEGPPVAEVSEEEVPIVEGEAPEEEVVTEVVPGWEPEAVPIVSEAAEEPPSMEEVSIVEEEISEAEVVTEVVPGWEPETLPTAEETEEVPVMDMAAAEEEAPEEEAPEEEMPEWLRDLGVPEVEEMGPPPMAEVAEEEVAPALEEEISDEEMPEWLRDLEKPEIEEVGPPPMAEVAAEEEEEAPRPDVSGEEMPEWLRDWGAPEAEEIVPPPVLEEEEEEAPSEAEVPASLLALVEAGLLDESDLESAMSEMSHEALEAQRGEEVPGWLEELMDNGVTPVHEEGAPVTDARLVTREAPAEEMPERLGEAEEVPADADVAIPIVEAPAKEAPSAEEAVLPIIGAPVEEAPPAEEVVLPIVGEPIVEEALVEEKEVEEVAPPIVEAPPVEEVAPEVEAFAPPAMEPPVEGEIEAPSRMDELLEALEAKPRNYAARLELARLYGDAQDWTSALTHYEKLVSARKLLPDVVGGLEALAEEGVERARVYQLLGDAYMQQDQLDKALEMYRLARESLTKR
ncbi:MAG: tetratricopeptide repeat protein [Anaerolineae bacterium]